MKVRPQSVFLGFFDICVGGKDELHFECCYLLCFGGGYYLPAR